MTNFLLAPGNAAAGKGLSPNQLSSINNGLIPSNFFRGNNSESSTVVPKAYINYIFFDEQFKFSGGGASRVGTSGLVKNHWYVDTQLQNINVPKNGYIFVYVSNESNFDVFFDNLQVIHKPGPILEETHYYPFGLTMSGISSKAAGGFENKKKFNDGTELNTAFDINLYETKFRSLDPQLGRFWQVDPLDGLSQNTSLYSFASNNPILRNDPLGLKDTTINGNVYKELPEIVIAMPQKLTLFYWPQIHPDQGKWSNEMYARQRDNRPFLQGNEPPWVLNNLDFYKKVYKNELNYRRNQITVVLIMVSPILLTIAPEVVAAVSGLSSETSVGFLNNSLRLHYETNLALHALKNKLLGSILDGMLKMQGLNAIYSKTFWDISSEMGEYRQPFNGKSLELIIKKFIKLIDKNLKY